MAARGTAAAAVLLLVCCSAAAQRVQSLPQWTAGGCLGAPRCDARSRYRTYDGSCSGLGDPSWGLAGRPFIRTGPPAYADGSASPRRAAAGGPLPNARRLSAALFRDRTDRDPGRTLMAALWGQFVAHDFTQKRLAFASVNLPCCTDDFKMLPEESLPRDCLPVEVSGDDYFYGAHGVTCLSFYRATALEGGDCSRYAREQVNNISQVIDGSVLYGSSEATARAMRSFVGGKLRAGTSEDGRPFLANDTRPVIPCRNPRSESKCYFAGDERVNQNSGLVVLTTALSRLHNHLCERVAALNPHWGDETLYQEVRRIVWAFLQHVTFKHYLPVVLGREFVERKGFLRGVDCVNFHDPEINPSAYHEFSGAAFRTFHSLVARQFHFVDESYGDVGSIDVDDYVFTRPQIVEKCGANDRLMRGLTARPCQKMDRHITVALTNLFFKQNRTYGGDLEIFDIMSGRDMGISPYIDLRYLCDGSEIKDFDGLADVMTDESISKLREHYASVEDIDLFVGLMMEEVRPGTLVGPTCQCIVGEQFYHFMVGDRFYYENCGFPWSFTPEQTREIRKTSIAWMFCLTGDHVESVTLDSFHTPSEDNPVMRCEDIPHLDLLPWLDYDGSK